MSRLKTGLKKVEFKGMLTWREIPHQSPRLMLKKRKNLNSETRISKLTVN